MTLPAVPDSFRWSDETWGPALRCVPLDAVARHLFTTRHLQLTDAGEQAHLARAVGAHALTMVTQVHGTRVIVARDSSTIPSRAAEADALASTIPDLAVGV